MTSFGDLEKCVKANISAPNNDIRTQAETHLKELKNKHPQQFFEGICQLIMKSNDCNVRSFSAVLLKQNLGIFDDTFFKIPLNSQNQIKELLLNQIRNEENHNVTRQIAECVSCLQCLLLQNTNNNNNNSNNSNWSELMPFLVKLSSSDSVSHRIAFYITMDKLACNALDILRSSNMEKLRDILISGLQDKNDTVRESALSAVVALLCGLNEANELNYFMNIVPLLFNNININIGDKTICKTCENLQILAEGQPNFFINSMKPIIECLVNVTKCNKLQWDTRKLSMNLLITLLCSHCNQIQNNLVDIANRVIPLIFDFLSTFDDNLEWNSPDDDVEQINYKFASDILPVIVSIFGADTFLTITKPVFDSGFADSADWKSQLIALRTIELTLEGCVEKYEYQLTNIINATGKLLLNSENKFVKYQSLLVIKQLSVVFGDDKLIFLLPFNEPIMNAFCSMLNNQPQKHHRCVLIQVCDALAHFAYIDEENEIIHKYSSSILNGLFNLIKCCNDNLIQSYALKATSVIISIIQEEFKSFYPILMKFCTDLLQKIYTKKQIIDESGLLRGRCMECIGGMLLVVDIDECRDDAHNIIKYLLSFQKQEQENATSEAYTYMMSLFASIAEALTNEFTPYLQHVIPPLLQSAQKKTVTMSINNNNNNDDDDNKDDLRHIIREEFGGIKFQVNTAEMNEKLIAVQQFPRYAVCLEGELLQFVKPISMVLTPIIRKHTISSEGRRNAIETMCPLVNCLKCGLISKNLKINEVNKWITEFVEELLPPLIDAMNVSDEVDEFSLICKSIQDLLDYIDSSIFKNGEIISDITEQIQTAIKERQLRRDINEEKSIDLIDTDIEEDVEADLADTVVDLVTKLVNIFGNKYISIFDKHCGKQCIDLLDINNNNIAENDQILSLSMLTEIIRYGGNEANKYISYVLTFNQHYLSLNTTSAPLKQSICYAIGICAIKQCLNTNNLSKWLNLLKNIIDSKDSRNDFNIDATENAISAIGKICKSYSNQINNSQNIIIGWIQMLPLINDIEEREFCNHYLLSILQKTNLLNDIIKSKNIKIIEKLINIMAVSIYNDDKAKEQYKQLFNHLNNKCDSNIIQKCIAELTNELQSVFQ